jgi:hypothetical protein
MHMGLFKEIVKDNQITPDDVPRIEAALFYEGDKRRLNPQRSLEILSKCKIDDILVVIELDQVFGAR